MYKVAKDIGKSENVYLQNTDTMAEINLGRITPGLLRILEKDGYTFDTADDTSITLKEKWSLKVSEEVKTELGRLAMPMKKPIRDQRKKPLEDKPTEESKQPVDVLDIIYGLA